MCFSKNIFKFSIYMFKNQTLAYYIPAVTCIMNVYEKINMFPLPKVIVSFSVYSSNSNKKMSLIFIQLHKKSIFTCGVISDTKKNLSSELRSTLVFPCNLFISGLYLLAMTSLLRIEPLKSSMFPIEFMKWPSFHALFK